MAGKVGLSSVVQLTVTSSLTTSRACAADHRCEANMKYLNVSDPIRCCCSVTESAAAARLELSSHPLTLYGAKRRIDDAAQSRNVQNQHIIVCNRSLCTLEQVGPDSSHHM